MAETAAYQPPDEDGVRLTVAAARLLDLAHRHYGPERGAAFIRRLADTLDGPEEPLR